MPTPSEWEGNYKVYRVTVQKWGVPKKMPPPSWECPISRLGAYVKLNHSVETSECYSMHV